MGKSSMTTSPDSQYGPAMETTSLLSPPGLDTGKQEYLAPYIACRGLSVMPPSVNIQTLSPRLLTAPTL